jgi:hypothetical protein
VLALSDRALDHADGRRVANLVADRQSVHRKAVCPRFETRHHDPQSIRRTNRNQQLQDCRVCREARRSRRYEVLDRSR